MEERTLVQLDLLARVLLIVAAIVLVMSIIGAVLVGSVSEIPGFEEIQRQGRELAALGAFIAGIVAAGVLAGLGGILRLLVAERRDQAAATAAASRAGSRGGDASSGGAIRR